MSDQSVIRANRPQISVGEINVEWLEDRDLAESLAQDCLRLFETTEKAFNEVRQQAWYKKLWSTVTGGNTRKLAMGCATLAQAQQMLLAVLQSHAEASNKSNVLLMFVARGLRHLEGQQNQVVATIINMADRIELLEKEVQLHRRLLESDPSNETTWNPEQRLLLIKAMSFVAGKGRRQGKLVRKIFEMKLEELEFEDEYFKAATSSIDSPEDPTDELDRIDSYQMRLSIFKNAYGILHVARASSETKTAQEKVSELASILQVKKRDRDKIEKLFLDVPVNEGIEEVMEIMNPGRRRGRSAPGNKEFEKIDHARLEMQRAAQERERQIQETRSELAKIGPQWAEYVARIVSRVIISPVAEVWETYNNEEFDDVEKVVAAFNTELILNETNSRVANLRGALDEIIGQYNQWHPLSPRLYRRFDEVWKTTMKDDGGWESALAAVQTAGINLLEAKPSGLGQIVKGGALGYAAGALLGPLGILGGMAAAHFLVDKSDQKKFEGAANQWDSSVRLFIQATERWEELSFNHIQAYLEDIANEIDQIIEKHSDVVDTRQPLLLMQADMEETDEK